MGRFNISKDMGWGEEFRDKLPGWYVWTIQEAKKRNRKGKAMEGMVWE